MRLPPSFPKIAALLSLLVLTSCPSPPLRQARPARPGDQRLLLTLTDLPWAVEIQAEGFVVQKRQTLFEKRKTMFMASNTSTGVIISMFLEPAVVKGGAKECREHYLRLSAKNPIPKEQFKLWEQGDAAMAGYVYSGLRPNVDQKHVHAYLVKDGMWVDLHVSIIPWTGDDRLLEEVVKAVRFRPYAHDVVEYLTVGSHFYLERNWAMAIENYREALDLEKKERRLSKIFWRVLVDNLGMAYGISGDHARAKETFEYGLSQDPVYPMFHYNLACTYAETGRLDPAIDSLKRAFSLRSNVNPTEKMPDPAKDSSFKRYLDEPKFRNCLKDLGN